MKQRVAIHTLGCKANQADATYLEGMLRHRGYDIVSLNEVAEYYILNTCTVTDEADREARQLSRRAKRNNPHAKVIVTGCYAQTQADAVAALDSVDAVVGNVEKDNIPNLLPSVGAQFIAPLKSHIRKQKSVPSFGLSHYSKNTRAQVKIQDGCDKFCSFCIIPFARGNNRSVPPQDILRELHQLREHGFEEAVLTGIHIGTYGLDRGYSLEQLLGLIAMEQPLPRIRLSSLDPEEVTDRLIEIVADNEIFCPHFHIAVQSGDNHILDRMKRRYQIDRFYHVIDKITSVLPNATLGTDILVGFPGETEEQFERSYHMIEDLPISYAHVFPYSKRKGTHAAHLSDQIPHQIKKSRTQRLRALSQTKKLNYYRQFIGQSLELVVESKRDIKQSLLRGVSRNYIPVHFQGDASYFRQRIMVTVDALTNNRVYGHVS